jgi:hypothetical protein
MKKAFAILMALVMLVQSFAFADVVSWTDEYYNINGDKVYAYQIANVIVAVILIISVISIIIIALAVKSKKGKIISIVCIVLVSIVICLLTPAFLPSGNISHGRIPFEEYEYEQ